MFTPTCKFRHLSNWIFQGLGHTVASLMLFLAEEPFPKTKFTMLTEEVLNWLSQKPQIDTILLCGIETHVCVNATVIDLLHQNYYVGTFKSSG